MIIVFPIKVAKTRIFIVSVDGPFADADKFSLTSDYIKTLGRLNKFLGKKL
jgi:hypothetical protein